MGSKVVIFCGSKTPSVKCLEHILNMKDIVPVVFGHKKEEPHELSLREFCKDKDIQFKDQNINTMANYISKFKPDFLISVQYGPILKKPILDIPKVGCFNLHNGDLPRYGGCKPVLMSIWNGDSTLKTTFHRMDEGIDTGPTITKTELHIHPDETAKELYPRLINNMLVTFRVGYDLVRYKSNLVYREPKRHQLYYKMQALDVELEKRVVWSERMKDVHNRIRAFTLVDGTFPTAILNDKPVCVFDSKVEPDFPANISHFGEVLAEVNGRTFVAVRDGVISVKVKNV